MEKGDYTLSVYDLLIHYYVMICLLLRSFILSDDVDTLRGFLYKFYSDYVLHFILNVQVNLLY